MYALGCYGFNQIGNRAFNESLDLDSKIAENSWKMFEKGTIRVWTEPHQLTGTKFKRKVVKLSKISFRFASWATNSTQRIYAGNISILPVVEENVLFNKIIWIFVKPKILVLDNFVLANQLFLCGFVHFQRDSRGKLMNENTSNAVLRWTISNFKWDEI